MASESKKYWESMILRLLNMRQNYRTERLLSEEFREEESVAQLILERLTELAYEIISTGDGKILAERGRGHSISEYFAYAIRTGRDIPLLDNKLILEIETTFPKVEFHFFFPDWGIEKHHIAELEKEVDLLMPVKPVKPQAPTTQSIKSFDVDDKSIVSNLVSKAAKISRARHIAKNVFWFVSVSTLGLSLPLIVEYISVYGKWGISLRINTVVWRFHLALMPTFFGLYLIVVLMLDREFLKAFRDAVRKLQDSAKSQTSLTSLEQAQMLLRKTGISMKTWSLSRTLICMLFLIIFISSSLIALNSSVRILSPFIFLISLFALQTQIKLFEYSVEDQTVITNRPKLLAENLTTLAYSAWFLLWYDAYVISIVVNNVEIREILFFLVYLACLYTWMGYFFLRAFFKKAGVAMTIVQTTKGEIVSQARSEVLKSLVSVILSLTLANLVPKIPTLKTSSEDPKVATLVILLNEFMDTSRFGLLTVFPLGLSLSVLAIGVIALWSNRKVLRAKKTFSWVLSIQFLSTGTCALKDFVSKKGIEIAIFLGGISLLSISGYGKEIRGLSSLPVTSFIILSIGQAVLLVCLVLRCYYWTRVEESW